MLGRLVLLVVACVALSGLPAHADPSKPWVLPPATNWYGYHSGYTAHCNMQADSQGLWGRETQYEDWCKNNTRYRNATPDQQWMTTNPWDHGNQNDHPQNH
jgi:hypothetical protein